MRVPGYTTRQHQNSQMYNPWESVFGKSQFSGGKNIEWKKGQNEVKMFAFSNVSTISPDHGQ